MALLVLSFSTSAVAQIVDLDKDHLLIAPLPALWRFHAGDNPAWADPKFDDSGWSLLRSDQDWSAQGYKGYSGMGWYRFKISIPATIDKVSFTLPAINNSFEVFVDRNLVGTYGGMPPRPRVDQNGYHTLLYTIPPGPATPTSGNRQVTVAIRVWLWPLLASFELGGGPTQTGGMVGEASQMEERRNLTLAGDFNEDATIPILLLLYALTGLGSLTLYTYRRRELEYLWIGLRMLCVAFRDGVGYSTVAHVWTYHTFTLADQMSHIANTVLYIAFFVSLLNAPRNWFLKLAIACAVLQIPNVIMETFFTSNLTLAIGEPVDSLLTFVSSLWILFTLFSVAVKKSGAGTHWIDARLLLLPFLLRTAENWLPQANGIATAMHWKLRFPITGGIYVVHYPIPITLLDVIELLSLLAIFAVLILRFARTSGEQERYVTEVEGARHVQQFLIPEDLPKIPGLTFESDYRPAREVGGDFFQVIPDPTDGSALILVGDVAGKGMQAGMLATLLVGAMRTAATFSSDPAIILSTLNNRLCGQGNATCLALRIESDGAAILVNAGHLPPYLNGRELPMEGALPLGTIPNIDFPILQFHISPGDTLTLISDGILEAQKPDGELFGFERITQHLATNSTASSLATAAQDFGQEDDITVLTIARASFAV
jgi:hypothetical protein